MSFQAPVHSAGTEQLPAEAAPRLLGREDAGGCQRAGKLGPRVNFSVKNTFVELEEPKEEGRPLVRRAKTLPLSVLLPTCTDTPSGDEADDGVSSAVRSSGLSTACDASEAEATPSGAEDPAPPGGRALAELAPDYVRKVSVKNTFVEVVEDDVDEMEGQPRVRRAITDPNQHEEDDVEDVSGQVWERSRAAEGCWAVRRALEAAGSEEERLVIACELRGHVLDAMLDPHANLVLQKCIALLSPTSLQFIVDEVTGSVGSAAIAARSYFGSQVLERLFEHASRAQTMALGDGLLAQALAVCRHRHGQHVMCRLADRAAGRVARRLAELLAREISAACLNENARCVVAHLLAPTGPGSETDRRLLGRALRESPGLEAKMGGSEMGAALVRYAKDLAAASSTEPPASAEPPAQAAAARASGASSRHRRRGAGGGDMAQATAEARDLLESLRAACNRRNPHRIMRVLQRVQVAALAPGAVPLLCDEAPRACYAAQALLEELARSAGSEEIQAPLPVGVASVCVA